MKSVRHTVLTKFVVLVTLLFCANHANANLIINGGFETPEVRKGGWNWFTSDKVDGWSGSNIEVWDNLFRFSAFEGEQHAELNAHPSNGEAFSIFQAFDTQIGQRYQVSFAYAARRNTREAFQFELYSQSGHLFDNLIDDHEVRTWSVFTSEFVATDLLTTIRFTSVRPHSRTVGNLLDAVSVTEAPSFRTFTAQPVNEPLSSLLLALGLTALIGLRKKK